MKTAWSRRFSVLAIILFLAGLSPAATGPVVWQTGRVTAIEINGQGMAAKADGQVRRENLWWTYSICSGARTYTAVSRMSPARLGLEVDSKVIFSATTSQITMRDARGKQYIMRILRQTESKDCAGR